MSERFSDENFIQAAKAYQNIKAPSDLRERVLAAAESAAQQDCGRSQTAVSRSISVPAGKKRGKIYHIASLAACMAIMVAALPNWLPGEEAGEPAGRTEPTVQARIITEPPVDIPEVVSSEEPQPEIAAFALEDNSEGTAPVREERQVSVAVGTENDTKAEGEGEQEDFKGDAESSETDEFPHGVAASKLIPGMAASAVLGNLEVRLVEGEDGTCTVEVTNSEKTAAVSVAKNAESGQWEVMETEHN